MQPSWMSPSAGGPYSVPAAEGEQGLTGHAQTLLQQIVEVERALAGREWWLLGRAFAEAQALSEIASLLAAVRGELEGVLSQYFATPPPSEPESPAIADDEMSLLNDPGWVQARQGEAAALLDHLAMVLPSLLQYAHQLQASAGQAGLPPAAVDELGIVRERLSDACETLQQPPS
jgi:hypothetical protein